VANIGVFCLPMPSHLNLFFALSAALSARGHSVTFFALSEIADKIRKAGFGFAAVDPAGVPTAALDHLLNGFGTQGLVEGMRADQRFDDLRGEAILQQGASLVKQLAIDGLMDCLIVDQAEAWGGTVAEAAGLPWVSVSSGLAVTSDTGTPPIFTPWAPATNVFARARDRLTYAGIRLATLSTQTRINRHRKRLGLRPLKSFDDTLSPHAQISQLIREFDFPRQRQADCFHYVGPIAGHQPRPPVDFPWSRLNGGPLIYASLGTVNKQGHVHAAILESCANLNVQLVLSLGGAAKAGDFTNIPANTILVDFAPQLELLSRAALTITHGGLNTVLESLMRAVPVAAIPINFDQPGVAARLRWSGSGDFVPAAKVNAKRLRGLVERVLNEPTYRNSARRLSESINRSTGVEGAAAIIEKVIAEH
jgi:zeaxanthin glucosyltransferase